MLPRKILSLMYYNKEAVRLVGTIYVVVLIQSYHSDGHAIVRGKKMDCRRGELFTSVLKLSSVTRIPATTVTRALKKLEMMGFITIKTFPYGNKITVLNYEQITRQGERKTGKKELTAAQKMALYEERVSRGIISVEGL